MKNTEIIYGQVIAKANSYQAVPDKSNGGRKIIKNRAIREYEQSFISQCKIYRDKLINEQFKLIIAVYHSNNRYDLDNSIKTILDCLQMVGAITNDNLCYSIDATKHISKTKPRVEFSIELLNNRLF